jgi:hypothetical protein
VEALYANINQVHTSADSEPSTLEKPFRIEVQKSQTITNYRVYYRGVSPSHKIDEHCN